MSYVPPEGPLDAKIAIVGEAPGAEEVAQGRPFVGASGKLLTGLLSASGIDRNSCYITNVMKQRPPGNDFSTFYLDPKCQQPSPALLLGIEELKKELKNVRPNIIIPLGSEPLRALTGKHSISSWRGSLLNTPQGKVCGTYHPAYILRQYTDRVTVEHDLRRASSESHFPELQLPHHEFQTSPSFDEVMSFLGKRPPRIAFDIETSGPFVRCFGIADRIDHALCIPFMAQPKSPPFVGDTILFSTAPPTRNSYWPPEQELEILKALDALFRDTSVQKVAQNFPFDSLVVARDFGIDTSLGFYMDTMVAHHTCYSELPKGLDYLGSIYTRVPYWSDHDVSDDHQNWIYNCFDCCVTLEVSYALDQELEKTGNTRFYHDHIHPALLAYTRAETRGVRIDTDIRSALSVKTHQECTQLEQEILVLSNGQIKNPRSPKQVGDYFYGTLRIPPILDHKTKKATAGEEARDTIGKKYPEHRPLCQALDTYTKKASVCSRLLDRELGADGRIRTHYNVSGTAFGRLSSSEPLFDPGTNLQNIDRGEIRRLFISDPGWVFVKADLSQAQWRICVWKARIQRVIDEYIRNPSYSVHKWFASQVYQRPEKEVGKGTRQYDTAKNGVYAGMFGVYYRTFHITVNKDVPYDQHVTLQEARLVLDKFHQLFPEIKNVFHASIQQEINSTRKVRSPLGRQYIAFDRLDDSLYRAAYAGFAQMVEADVIHQAVVRSDRDFDDNECYLCLQVHDEVVFQCREELVHTYVPEIKQRLEIPITLHHDLPPLIIPADVGVGKNWYDVKPLEAK